MKIANATLELATEQSQQSAILAKDSIRARLDIKAPAISMTMRRGTSRAAESFIIRRLDSSKALQSADPFEEALFELPGDSDMWIYAVYLVSFHNEGLVPVTIRSSAMCRANAGAFVWQETLRVPVGESGNAMLAIGASVEDWATALGGISAPLPSGSWETVMHENTGVLLSQEFHVEAPMIQPVDGDENGDSYCIPRMKTAARKRSSIVFGDQRRAYVIAGEHVESLTPTVSEANMLALKDPKQILSN